MLILKPWICKKNANSVDKKLALIYLKNNVKSKEILFILMQLKGLNISNVNDSLHPKEENELLKSAVTFWK